MLNFLNALLSSQGFIPHGHCYLWKPALVWLHVVSDGVIAIAYYSIPVLLIYFISKRRDIPFNWVFILFGAFIIFCGTGHLLDIWTLWHPTYWLSGVFKALTAIISLYTALELIPLLPKALALPSPAQLEAANRELEQTLQKLQQAQAQLIQTEKMSSLGQLVAGIAHEINNPVNFIYGNLTYVNQYTTDVLDLVQLYQQTYPTPPAKLQAKIEATDLDFVLEDLPKILSSLKVGADRIRQIVLSLRNFSRIDEAEMKPANIHDGIDSTLLILQSRLKAKAEGGAIAVIKTYGDIPDFECYPSQLNQVFMNILSNAIDALDGDRNAADSAESDRKITIETCLLNPDQVLIQISDNGSGMPAEVLGRIFNPFFTTKPIGQGTGLGLSISYQIVTEKHGGCLECHSVLGEGTTFQIKLPIRQVKQLSTNSNLHSTHHLARHSELGLNAI
jgi:two-component system, NtrC family, sensor kinase